MKAAKKTIRAATPPLEPQTPSQFDAFVSVATAFGLERETAVRGVDLFLNHFPRLPRESQIALLRQVNI